MMNKNETMHTFEYGKSLNFSHIACEAERERESKLLNRNTEVASIAAFPFIVDILDSES